MDFLVNCYYFKLLKIKNSLAKIKNIVIKDTKVKTEKQYWYDKYPVLSLLVFASVLFGVFYFPLSFRLEPDAALEILEKNTAWDSRHYCGVHRTVHPLSAIIPSHVLSNPLILFIFQYIGILGFALLFYRFLRQLFLPKIVCFFTSVLVIFLPQVYHIGILQLSSLIIFPLFLEMVLLLGRKNNALYFSLSSILLGFLLSMGDLNFAILMIVTAVVLYSFELKDKKSPLFSLLLLFGCVFFGLAISAAFTLPPLEAGFHTISYKNLDCQKDLFTTASLSFHQLLLFFIPSRLLLLSELENMHHAGLFSYFVPSIIFLAGIGLLLRRDNLTKALSVIAIISVLFALGPNNPFFFININHFSKHLFLPADYLFFFNLTILILAGIGTFELLRTEKQILVIRYTGFFLLIVVIGTILALWFRDSIVVFKVIMTVFERNTHLSKLICHSLKSIIGLLLLTILILLFSRNRIGRPFLFFSFILLIILELWAIKHSTSQQNHEKTPLPQEIINIVDQDSSFFRIYSVLTKPQNYAIPSHWPRLTGECGPRTKLFNSFLQVTGFDQNANVLTNPFLAKYQRTVIRDNKLIYQPVPALSIPGHRLAFDNNMLDMLNVKYIISPHYIHDQHYQLIIQDSVFLYQNNDVKSRVFFADSVSFLSGKQAIFDHIGRLDFSSNYIAFLEEKLPSSIRSTDSNTVDIITYSSEFVDIQTSIKTPALLILSDIYYPAGWHAYVNGQKTKIYKTTCFLRSVFLEPGDHRVQFKYKPLSRPIGFIVSLVHLVFLLGLLFVVLVNRVKKKK